MQANGSFRPIADITRKRSIGSVIHRVVNALIISFSINALLLAGALVFLLTHSGDGPTNLPLETVIYLSTIIAAVWAVLLAFAILAASLISFGLPRPGLSYTIIVLIAVIVLLATMTDDWNGPWSGNPYSIWNGARWELGWLFVSTAVAATVFWRLDKPKTDTRRAQ